MQLHGRAHFVVANATISMRSLLESYPGPIELLCVQFPDPHFKAKHQKRHTVQREFCEDAAHILKQGGACRTRGPTFCTRRATCLADRSALPGDEARLQRARGLLPSCSLLFAVCSHCIVGHRRVQVGCGFRATCSWQLGTCETRSSRRCRAHLRRTLRSTRQQRACVMRRQNLLRQISRAHKARVRRKVASVPPRICFWAGARQGG